MTPTEILAPFRQQSPVNVQAAAGALGLEVGLATMGYGQPMTISRSPTGAWRVDLEMRLPDPARRYAIAHAIAHFVLHHDQIERLIGRTRVHVETPTYQSNLRKVTEAEADAYALDLLMPEDRVAAMSDRGHSDVVVARAADTFGVAHGVARRRLEGLGRLAPVLNTSETHDGP